MSEAARARALGVLSIALFFVPLVAPLVQGGTLVYALHRGWRGSLDRTSVIVAAAGAGLGFILFLATEYVWIV
jgi:hypothetical protein